MEEEAEEAAEPSCAHKEENAEEERWLRCC